MYCTCTAEYEARVVFDLILCAVVEPLVGDDVSLLTPPDVLVPAGDKLSVSPPSPPWQHGPLL